MVFPEKFVHTTYWHKIIWHTNQFGQLWTKLLTSDNRFYRILLSSSFYVIEWGLRIHNYVYGIKAAKLWLDSPDMLLKIVYLSIFMQKNIYLPKYLPYFHSDYKDVNKAWHVVFLILNDIKITVHWVISVPFFSVATFLVYW